jgi:hypothetical protein
VVGVYSNFGEFQRHKHIQQNITLKEPTRRIAISAPLLTNIIKARRSTHDMLRPD